MLPIKNNANKNCEIKEFRFSTAVPKALALSHLQLKLEETKKCPSDCALIHPGTSPLG